MAMKAIVRSTMLNNADALKDLALENCDKEPVHTPGHIQDFAVLIATDAGLTHITHCSANAEDMFGKPSTEILGSNLSEFLGATLIHDLNNTLSLSSSRIQRERVANILIDNRTFDIWAHVSGNIPVIEFEPVQSESLAQNQSILNVRSLLARLSQNQDIQDVLKQAVVGLRHLTEFDRVLAYQFDSNGDGEVVAEALGPQLSSFMGLRFPKWDIPNQARAIMKKLPLRMISDVDGTPVNLLAAKDITGPLDISLAASRGVSPIHMEYLRNMGVAATMTLSIVVHGELWGLFAFHHASPRNIGPSLRGASELFAQFFSLQMEQRIGTQLNQARANALEYQSVLLDAVENALNLSELVDNIAGPLCHFVDADGMALISENAVFTHGNTPASDMVIAIAKKLLSQPNSDFVMSDSLSDHGFDVEPSAGAIALVLDEETKNTVVFFRNEASLSVKWAGAPIKDIVEEGDSVRLVPRGSFKAYQESVEGKSRPWDHVNIFAAEQARVALTKADSALFRKLSNKMDRQRSIYIAELNHRVRNILSLIRSLSRRTQENSYSLEAYAKALESRISALGAAHDLAANHVINGIVIHELFEIEAKPFENSNANRFVLTGKKFVLRSDIAPIFALIVHELMTNSVKHGALSAPDGSIKVDINEVDEGISITWTEQGGPEAIEPSRHGFGMGLIQSAVPYELDGRAHIEFRPEGLTAEFWIPMKLVTPLAKSLDTKPTSSSRSRPVKNVFPKNMLILEDSLMLAIDMSDMLKQIGVTNVEKCASIAQAKRALSTYTPEMAVLDISLRDEESFEIAYLLLEKQIPFCFATGFGSEFPVPKDLHSQIVLTKPVDIDVLRSTIKTLCK